MGLDLISGLIDLAFLDFLPEDLTLVLIFKIEDLLGFFFFIN
jgi:hypothetical protein